MSELKRLKEERLKKEKEERDKKKQKQVVKSKNRDKEVEKIQSISHIQPNFSENLLKEQKAQTKLLKQLVELLQNREPSMESQIVELTDPQTIKQLITNYIRGTLPGDILPSNKTHRSYRDDEFIERVRKGWNIHISKQNARLTRLAMEKAGELVGLGYLRFVLPEFMAEEKQKTSPKDLELIRWLSVHSNFTSHEFQTELYSNQPPGAASSKINAIIRKGWITRIRRSHYRTTEVLLKIHNKISDNPSTC